MRSRYVRIPPDRELLKVVSPPRFSASFAHSFECYYLPLGRLTPRRLGFQRDELAVVTHEKVHRGGAVAHLHGHEIVSITFLQERFDLVLQLRFGGLHEEEPDTYSG